MASSDCCAAESLRWCQSCSDFVPPWSRLRRRNSNGHRRHVAISKLHSFDIECAGCLWSLWGNLHPATFSFAPNTRGRQYLACCVLACCAADSFALLAWNAQLLDAIVRSADKYFKDSIATIKTKDYNFTILDLNTQCTLQPSLHYLVHIEHVVFGQLYGVPKRNRMNLAKALNYFFSHFQFGIVQAQQRALAIGYSPGQAGGYFMYDCQSAGAPVYAQQQAATYLLRTQQLQLLLYCIVVTLNIRHQNVQFYIHKVELMRK